ncbi:MAG TPA: amidohydrolase family protein [Caulobacteraceae bacterium]|nr:amidohydrolase family protein [Caulobacteraceae bacterium]
MNREFDLVIRGGNLADGTGGEIREGDIAIKDGKIAALGKFAGDGAEEIEAKGKLVTPGFVDVHTHYDGQVTWADRLTPTSSHGVTTAIMGNCGVGFAPCRVEDRDEILKLFEGVEDIPGEVLSAGLPWNWETFPDYLNALDRRQYDVDFAVLLPHSPMRVYVMGQRAIDLEPANEDDRMRMRAITRAAMEAGAVGFSTSRDIFHYTKDGRWVPCFKSEEIELREIAMGMKDAGRGLLQTVLITENQCLEDYEEFHRVARAAERPLTYTLLSTNEAPDLWRDVMNSIRRDTANGQSITAQIFNRPVGAVLGLDSSLCPFSALAFYAENLASLPLEARVAEMRKPEVKAALLADKGRPDLPLYDATHDFRQLYPMSNPVNYEPDASQSVEAIAAARGVSPYEVLYDAVMADNGRGKVMLAAINYSRQNLDHAYELMNMDHTVLSLGDGGAHCGIICDASYTTTSLMHWARDRSRGPRVPLAQVVKKLTADTADLYGFSDRGRLAVGLKADVNIIDYDNLTLAPPVVTRDLPANGARLLQHPKGYEATIVSGVVTQRHDAPTSALPGRLIRSGAIAAR